MINPTSRENSTDNESEGTQVATKSEKANYRYTDFYCFMSLSDFTAYVSRDDMDGEDFFPISTSQLAA
jgi:hypothetical protein